MDHNISSSYGKVKPEFLCISIHPVFIPKLCYFKNVNWKKNPKLFVIVF